MPVPAARATTRRVAARSSAAVAALFGALPVGLAALAVTLGTALAAPPAAAVPAVAVPAAAPVSATVPTDDVTWGVRTATNDQGTERENFRYTVDPGTKVSDELVVTNHGETPLKLDIYAADGYTTTAGQLDVLTRGDAADSGDEAGSDDTGSDDTGSNETGSLNVGSWLDPAVDQVRLAPGESADVPFTLRVPDDATPGDYAGAILTSRTVTAEEAGLDYETRSGIRVYLRVAGDLAPSLTVTDAHVEYHQTLNPFGPGDATVTYTVRNDGNVRLAANQDVGVAGPFGWLGAQGAAADVPELLPGESWPVSVPVDGVAPLFWLGADIVLVAQLPDVAGATPGVAPVEAHASGWAVPWLPLLVVVLLAGAVVVIVRRRRTRGQREDARVQAAVAQALAERAAAEGAAAEGAAADGAAADGAAADGVATKDAAVADEDPKGPETTATGESEGPASPVAAAAEESESPRPEVPRPEAPGSEAPRSEAPASGAVAP
ncbi:WxL protein peptidoglycan domain-containing protein [Promicromonospora sp. NPDC060204]|uniref:WxL protein peptidoglycan domain-containing protein n=1 Tax=Promicromonospora sp. NPDC060204 TaxID=3347071 RepID=UPI00365EA862